MTQISVERSRGNVFADLGLPNLEDHLAKAELASRLGEAIRQRRLTQAATAELWGIDQPQVLRLLPGYPTYLPAERNSIHFLNLLGRDAEFVVKPTPRSRRQRYVCVVEAA